MNWFWQSLYDTAGMLWETLWALVLGFLLSAFLQVFFRREQVEKQFGRTSLRSVGLATLLGAASSSCSFAAAATAKTAFKKGAALVPVLAFMFASTNLVLELGLILWLLLGWKFVLAEIIGAFVLIAVMWLGVMLTLPEGLVERARAHDGGEVKSGCGCGCGHEPEEEMADEPFRQKIKHRETWTRVAEAFIGDVRMLWKEILVGFLMAGFLMVLVPAGWWEKLFVTQGADTLRLLENAVVGSLAGAASFACSCGNIPLAGVLWRGGISFGGVMSFIYADLITVPLILIYRKYYGTKAALYITGVMFVSMVSAGMVVDWFFGVLGLVPTMHAVNVMAEAAFRPNYTMWLNFAALIVVGGLVTVRGKAK